MSQMDSRQTIPYGRKDLIYPQSHQTMTNPAHTYYPITGQLQYVESRIVTQNNSSLVSAINLNPNKLSAYQRSINFEHEYERTVQQTHVVNGQNNHQFQHMGNINNNQPTHKLSRPGSNKITVTNENNSLVRSEQRNQQSSLSKRTGSLTRGGIKVVSRNSSMQRKSQTSVQKSITSKNLNTGNTHHGNQQKTTTSIALCGMNCTTRNPFTQNEQSNQMTVLPNLGSLQTLKSGITSSHLPYSQRQHLHNNQNPSQQKLNKNFYDNISQRTHIEPSSHNYPHKNNSELIKENISSNGNNLEKIYKQVREMMEKQIHVAKKMYEKKCLDEIECLNTQYKTQIQTLQRVLGQNLTVIQEQGNKINKLQEKLSKKQAKAQKYSQRFQSLIKFIQKSNKFSLQRIDQVQCKFILLLTQFQSSHLTPSYTISLENKLSYLQQIFSTVIVKTIMKYRSIEYEIKQQIKQVMKKYEYYQQKIYEMDLMKHLGKENQIQNYRLIENIQGIRQKLVILESKANMRSQIRELKTGTTTRNELVTNNSSVGNLHKVEQLQRIISNMEYKLRNLQQEATQTSIKMYKLQTIKSQLQNKLSILDNQLSTNQKELIKIRTQRDQLFIQKQYLLKQIQKRHLQRLNQSPQKFYTNAYNFDLSSLKKSLNYQQQPNEDTQGSQAQIKFMGRQVERLQEIIQQYEAKIQQLHDAINSLEKQNSALITALNNKTKNQEKQKHIILQTKINQQKEQKQLSIDQSAIIQNMNKQLNEKTYYLQQLKFSFEQVTRQKQQLQQALQTTENIFDQQISKFKQTIRVLQEQNTQLLTQINQLRQGKSLGESASSTKSNIEKVCLAKSPKKEMCQTVTMNWFKKNVSNQQQQVDNSNTSNVDYSNNRKNKLSSSNLKSNQSSPINKYYAENNYKQQYKPNYNYQYTVEVKQQSSSNSIYNERSLSLQKDQLFYPQSIMNNNQSSRRSIDSTSIMQSHPNITPYYPTQNTKTYNKSNFQQGKLSKPINNKLETQKITKRYQTSTSSYNNNNRYQQYSRQGSEDNQQQEQETETYIF